MAMDITKRDQLEQMLRESPDVLAGIIEAAMDAIIAIDDAQRIVLFNAAAEKMFGCTADEATGNSVERFIPQRLRAGHSTRVSKFGARGVMNRTPHDLGTLWGLRATGEEFPIEASISKVEAGGKKFFTAVIRDITGRHRAEEALRESEQRFRLVADTAPALIWMSGTDKLCTYFNKPWLDFTGRSSEQELGNGWAEGVHPDDLQRCLNKYRQSFDRRERFTMEYRLRHRDGDYRWILDVGVPRFNEDGSFAGYIGICVDVNDRKQTEEALQHREIELTEAQRLAGLGSWQWDARIDKVIWSEELFRLVGRDPKLPAPSFKEHPSLFTAESWERLQGVVKEALQSGAPYELDMEILSPESTTKWATARGEPLRDSDHIVGLRGTLQDITERKHAEEALRESEEQFRTLAEAIPQLCWMAHGDGHIFWYNQRWYTYTGTTPEQMEGWGWQSVHDPLALPLVLGRWKTSIATGEPFDMVFPLKAADGVFHPFLTRITPVKDSRGRVVRWFGTNTDVTELRDATEAVRASEERLRLAQQIARIGSFDWNVQTGVNTWTPELEAMYGLQPGGFSQTQTSFENLVHADDRASVIKLVDRALKTGQSTEGEWRAVLPDGSVHWIAGRWQVLMNESGEPARMIGVNIDVTERKRAEEALLEVNRRLIEAQEQERARIARELHDDINQRLALAVIELEQWDKEHSNIDGEVHERIYHVKQRLFDLAKDVQALSHRLHSSKLDYLGLMVAARSFCRELSEQQKVEIEFTHEGVLSDVPKEVSLCLFRILQEALQNAVKYSGVRSFRVKLEETPAEIQLTISDDGVGFDQQAALRGRGLGLTSMRERMQLVKGDLSITSQADRGTTVCARVPFMPEDQRTRMAG